MAKDGEPLALKGSFLSTYTAWAIIDPSLTHVPVGAVICVVFKKDGTIDGRINATHAGEQYVVSDIVGNYYLKYNQKLDIFEGEMELDFLDPMGNVALRDIFFIAMRNKDEIQFVFSAKVEFQLNASTGLVTANRVKPGVSAQGKFERVSP